MTILYKTNLTTNKDFCTKCQNWWYNFKSVRVSKTIFQCRCVEEPDRLWFINAMKHQVEQELSEAIEDYPEEETFWVDFLREPPEATGDEPDDFCFDAPKIYEEIPSWEFLKEKLFCKSYLLINDKLIS